MKQSCPCVDPSSKARADQVVGSRIVGSGVVGSGVLLTLVIYGLVASGCSWVGQGKYNSQPTLAELGPATMPDTDIDIPRIALEDIEKSYHRALEVAESPQIRRKILTRLAGLQMARSEQEQLSAKEVKRFFDKTIDMYKELIELQKPHGPTDLLQYQLAKAYALDGRVEESTQVLNHIAQRHPESALIAEAQFRRAERFFSVGNYVAAEQSYAAVVAAGEQSPYYRNAVYMHGWSQFKRGRYRASLGSFTQILDDVSPPDGNFAALDGAQRNLGQDTLRVMSLVFSYLDGAQTITEVYKKLGRRPYHHLLYDHLGNLFLSKRRYRDSADTYRHYVEHFPLSDHSPGFAVKTIEVYERGNFPSLILPGKEMFVKNYGISSQYWAQKDEVVRNELRTYLHVYLPELAKYYHAEAQDYQKLTAKKSIARERQAYLRAARWYREFVDTFPEDRKTSEMVFLMAETLYEAQELPRAIDAYEKVAYQYRDKKYGAEAGYSAILAAGAMVQATADQARQQWTARKIDNAMKFADSYATDKRAPEVLTQVAQSLLEQGEHQKAILAARRITQWQPAVSVKLQRTAWLIQGHGLFDLQQYVAAEGAYHRVLQMLSPEDKSRNKIEERLAASIFKAAEQLLATDNKVAAIDQLLRIRQVVPRSDIAIKAQYDAASYLMELKRWREAQRELDDFRRRFPRHPLTPTIAAKLAVVYQELGQWQLAGDTLIEIYKRSAEPQAKRQSLFLAAELYEKSGNAASALLRYGDYVNAYPQPFDIAMEARYKLAQLSGQNKQAGKRRYWLHALIGSHKKAGRAGTDRSRYLAAYASSEMANDSYQRFLSIQLKLPLKKSLKKKKTALQQALAAYQKTLNYGVGAFTTLASFRIGEVYARLSRDLMDSERPKSLDALALEQYDILLEEQAFPFEEKAIEIHEANAQRSWKGIYDDWVKRSFGSLTKLLPARYKKSERLVKYSETIY